MHNILPSNVLSPVCTLSDTHYRLHWLRSDHIFPWWARLWFSHDKYVSSEQCSGWIALDRCVMCHKRKATLLLHCETLDITQGKLYGEGTKQGWEVNIFDCDPTSLLRQERAGEFDALIGGCWYRGLVPYHEQMLHIFFRASNNTFAWYLVNHELHLANQLGRLSYKNPLHYDWVWAFVPRVESISHFKFVYVPIHYSCPQIETE